MTDALPHIQSIACHDLQKPAGPLNTGIGFLDHMLDQINSHAQMGIHLVLSGEDKNRHAQVDARALLSLIGTTVGQAMRPWLPLSENKTVTFSCPLDEALVECQLLSNDNNDNNKQQAACEYHHFTPLGKYPPQIGRTHLGQLNVSALDAFWNALAEATQLKIVLIKHRGDNAHHIIESSFKAFSRALRNYIDTDDLYGNNSPNAQASIALQRHASLQRSTKETSIQVDLQLDGGAGETHVATGIPTLDRFWTQFAHAAEMTLRIQADGDLWIDEHHTAEDVAIAVGQCFDQALGSKAGLNRMWSVQKSGLQVTMDLSNRPCFVHDLDWGMTEFVGEGLSCEMMEHVLESWIVNARWTVHVQQERGGSSCSIDDLAQALGTAVRYCASVDVRRAGATASSKGTLSV